MLNFSQNPPTASHGFPVDHTYFSCGRTGVVFAKHGGILQIFHYAQQPLAGAALFRSEFPHSSWVRIFRLAVEIEGKAYYPNFEMLQLYPFGFESEAVFDGVRFAYALVVRNDALIQRVRILENAERKSVRLKVMLHGFVRAAGVHRRWSPWEWDAEVKGLFCTAEDRVPTEVLEGRLRERRENIMQAITFDDLEVGSGDTTVGVSATAPLHFRSVDGVHPGFKNYFSTKPFEKEAAFSVNFGSDVARVKQRLIELQGCALGEVDESFAAFKRDVEKEPKISLESPTLRSCFESIPGYVKAVAVEDVPGAHRASVHGYWVWSWDSLVFLDSLLYSNHPDRVKEVLLFTMSTCDPVLGFPHQLSARFTPQMALPFTVQGLFTVALYHYYNHTKDLQTLLECYPQACWILKKALEREAGDTGLIQEPSLYPDYPGLLDQDGKDLSSFNNSVFYQSLKALQYLASVVAELGGDSSAREVEARCAEVSQRTLASFKARFYDAEKGLFFDTVSSEDFTPRRYYPVYAILWVTRFAEDLLGEHLQTIQASMARTFPRPYGLSMFGPNDPAYMKDGNQFGAYYPVVEGFYRNVCKLAGNREGLEHWLEGVEWFWRQFTIPEGLTYDTEYELPDNPGTKQTFAAKSWASLFYRVFVGIEVDERGIVFSPSPLQEAVSVENIQIAGKRLDIFISGEGAKWEGMFNGKRIESYPFIVPHCELGDENQLVLRRSE